MTDSNISNPNNLKDIIDFWIVKHANVTARLNDFHSNDLKERQKINELQLKINREKQKLDKKLTRQKILLGAFMIELLETNKIDGLAQYTADNLEEFLTRQGDKELMGDVINNLKSQVNKVKNIETHI